MFEILYIDYRKLAHTAKGQKASFFFFFDRVKKPNYGLHSIIIIFIFKNGGFFRLLLRKCG
jgi:hypothetical protein